MENNYLYNAFISYRHLEKDKLVAEQLQKKLESFKPPKSVKPEGFKKWRIFRDETELHASDNLTDEIRAALRNSEYLITVCSNKTTDSPWCMEEIRYFKELHNGKNDNIITVLADGTPSTAIPPALLTETETVTDVSGNSVEVERQVMPLATNLVASTEKGTLKKLKTEILRIAAPLLGCSFDALYNRAQKQKRKNIIASGLIIIAILSVFATSIGALALNLKVTNAELEKERDNVAAANAELEKKNDELSKTLAALEQKTNEAEENLDRALEQESIAKDNEKKANEQRIIAVNKAKEAEENMNLAKTNEKRALEQEALAEKNAKEAISQKEKAEVFAKEVQKQNTEILSAQAELYFDNDDYTKATETAILAMENSEGSVPRAEKVVADILNVYEKEEASYIYKTATLPESSDSVDDNKSKAMMLLCHDGTRLVVKDHNSDFYIINTDNAQIIKRIKARETFNSSSEADDFIIDNNKLYILCADQLLAINLSNGSTDWHFNKDDQFGLIGTEIITHPDSSTIFLPHVKLYTLLQKDGTLLWSPENELSEKNMHYPKYIMDSDGTVFGADYHTNGRIMKILPQNGSITVRPLDFDSNFYVHAVAQSKDNIYVYGGESISNTSVIRSYAKENLSTVWSANQPYSYASSLYATVSEDGQPRLAAVSDDFIELFDAQTGEKLASKSIDDKILLSRLTTDGRLQVFSKDYPIQSLHEYTLKNNGFSGKLLYETSERNKIALSDNHFALTNNFDTDVLCFRKNTIGGGSHLYKSDYYIDDAVCNNNNLVATFDCALSNSNYTSIFTIFDIENKKVLSEASAPMQTDSMVFLDNNRLFATGTYGDVRIFDINGNTIFETNIRNILKEIMPPKKYIPTVFLPHIYTEGNQILYCESNFALSFNTDTLTYESIVFPGIVLKYFSENNGYFGYITKNTIVINHKDKPTTVITDKAVNINFEKLTAITLSKSETKLAFYSPEGYFGIYNLETGELLHFNHPYSESKLVQMHFTPDESGLIAIYSTGLFVNYSAETGQNLAENYTNDISFTFGKFEFIDNNTFLFDSTLFDVATVQQKGELNECMCYIRPLNKFFCNDVNNWYLYDYLDKEKLIEQGRNFLNN